MPLFGARRRRWRGGSNAGPSPGPAPLQLGAALHRAIRWRAASEPETAARSRLASSAQPRRGHVCVEHLGSPAGGWSPCPCPRRRPACHAAPTKPRSSGPRATDGPGRPQPPRPRRLRLARGPGLQGLRSLRWRRRCCTSWRSSLKSLRAGEQRAAAPRARVASLAPRPESDCQIPGLN